MRDKKNLISIKILLIVSGFLANLISGQSNYSNYYFPEPPKAPSSQEFLKYGSIQNNEYSGSNRPSINLFNLKSGSINLPINLNYISGNGIKVNEEAGEVGLGWNIAFPTIVQNIYGYDDFANNTRFRLDFAKSSLPYASSFPLANGPTNFNDLPTFNSYGYFLATNNNVPRNGLYSNLFTEFASVDMQPDIFVMNLFGEKVEFLISNFDNYSSNNNSSIIFTSLNKKGYKIEKTDLGFTIIDPKGFTYKFNAVEGIGEYSNGYLTKASGRNFHISEIIDTNSHKISFEYLETSVISNPISYSWFLNYTTNYNQNYCKQGSSGNLDSYIINDPAPIPNPNRFAALNNFINNFSDSGSQQKYLFPYNIIADNGKLVFEYSDRIDFMTKKLDRITLSTYNNIMVDKYDFSYDYFLPQVVETSNLINSYYSFDRNKRLKLSSIQKNNQERYTFYYNETSLPPKNSYAVDYWGYSNGGFNNKTMHLNPNDFNYNLSIPVTEINNNKKTPDINYIKGGILEKIEYPTKGYSTFTYEINEASNLFYQYNKYKYNQGNGLRLRENKNYDLDDNLLGTTTFVYENGLTPNPLRLIRQDNGEIFFEIGDCAGKPVVKTIQGSFVSMHSSSISNTFALSSGNSVGYSKVIRKEIDKMGNMNGSIETIYSNNEDIHFNMTDYNRPIFLPSVKGNKIENGNVLKSLFLDASSKKIKEEQFDYSVYNSPFTYGVTMIHPMYNSYVVDQLSGYFQHYKSAVGYYPIYSTETILKNKKNIDYIGGDSLITKTDLSFNANNQLISKSISFPDGRSTIENMKYSTEKNNTKLIASNILNVPLEKEIIGNIINGTPKRMSQIETKYDDINHLNPTSVLSYDIPSNSPSTEITYNLYDVGNILQYTTKEGTPITIIWGYNKTQPIAKIEGATYSQVMQAFGLNENSNEAYLQLDIVKKSDLDIDDVTENSLISELDNFRRNSALSGYQISTYTYNPLVGVTSITPPSGIRELYQYDSVNRLEKVVNINGNILKEYKYNYAPKKYYNLNRSQMFTRNNCGSNALGGGYTYTVPENKYSSIISQADADQQAQSEISANGQNMANINGTCTPLNCSISMYISGGGSTSLATPLDYRVQIGFSSGVGKPWTTTGVIIGKINGICIPQKDRISSCYSNGFLWGLEIKSNGEIVAKKVEGLGTTGVPDNTSYNLDFTYPVN